MIRTYTGVMTSTYRITPKLPMGDVDPYAAVNFSQTVDDHQPGYTLVQVVTRSVLDSDAPFPLDEASLPDEARMELLPQPGWIQSDDGQVVALKDTLLQDVTSQTEAVTEILAWVRAHTQLVPTCPANDALSVLASGEATFDGFVTLSCALLRAAGIPARTVSGIVLPGQVMEWDWGERANLWHAWIEVYYPDLGWVPSDPQATINWIDSAHIHSGFTGVSTPTVERVSHVVRMSYLGDMTTEHVVTHDAWMLWAASTDGEAVSPLTTDLARLYRIHQDAPVREIQGYVANDRLCGDAWELRVEAPWLSIMPSSGQGVVDVTLRLDATELGVGRHGAQVSLVGLPDGGCQPPAPPLTHTFTVELDVRGRPRSHLPLVRR
ncbi:MAG: transglutaminase-like domain-containing protein [Anaerolineae bacterium]